MVKDNSNLKQTWTRRIVSLHFWKIWLWTVWEQLRSICLIKKWENLYFCQIATFSLLTRKLSNRFTQNFIFVSSRDQLLAFLLSHENPNQLPHFPRAESRDDPVWCSWFGATNLHTNIIHSMHAAVCSEPDLKCTIKELWTGSRTDIPHQRVLGHPASIPHTPV